MCRYMFPPEPKDGVMDLTADERPFYINSYSGEMSLQYPKAERKCKGGILAYVIPTMQIFVPLMTPSSVTVGAMIY